MAGRSKRENVSHAHRWKDFEERRPIKRLQRTNSGKGSKDDKNKNEGRKPAVMEKWLKRDKGSVRILQSPKRKASDVGDLESTEQEERRPSDKGQLGT